MTWATRVGNIIKSLMLAILEIVALATEAVKIVAEHLDAIVDDLQGKITTGTPAGEKPAK